MNKSFLLMLCACSSVYAESRVLPPVVDNSIYPGGSAYSSEKPSANVMYEVLGRLEQLQSEVQQLRGVVEEQSQTILDLKKRQGNIYSDLDLRMQELAGVIVEFKPELKLKSSSEKAVVKQVKPVVEAKKALPVIKDVPVSNEKALYQTAYETLRNGHNTRAIAAFKAFLIKFPKGEYADNAQYWLGEAYKVNQDLNSAKDAFTKVVTDYAGSSKVADALLKLGYIELDQGNEVKARDYFTQVTVSHPGSTAAHLASKKLIQMGVMQP
ncbi:MAG: tol-pal system protein YbgF [Methylomarinum sp.]|nr:tol-pal system protein YbgF [Methylomarinum sp.]